MFLDRMFFINKAVFGINNTGKEEKVWESEIFSQRKMV